MKTYKLELESEKNDRNSLFSLGIEKLKSLLLEDESLSGNLKALGNQTLIREKDLAALISKKANRPCGVSQFALLKRLYSKEKGRKLNGIKKHATISSENIYLRSEADVFASWAQRKLLSREI